MCPLMKSEKKIVITSKIEQVLFVFQHFEKEYIAIPNQKHQKTIIKIPFWSLGLCHTIPVTEDKK